MKQTNKTQQFFRVIMFLCRGQYVTPKQLAEELDIEQRTIYRYIDDIKESPFFVLEQRGKKIRLSRESIFLTNIAGKLYLTDNEALALNGFLESLATKDQTLLSLQRKVRTTIGNYVAPQEGDFDAQVAENIERVHTAIDNQRLVLLRGYSSLHSDTKADRLVEPFAFLGSKNDVRCYELSSQMNKTFKVSRCESVEILNVDWQFEKRHKKMFTDIFHFSDESQTRVRLLLGNLSKTILLEEYPEARRCLIPHPDGRWMLDAEYCSMKGVGRFYLGLFEDIEIVDSSEFKQYLTDRIKSLTNTV